MIFQTRYQIDERTSAKKGISLKADAGAESSFVSSVSYVLNKRQVPNSSVAVYVRESSWMESKIYILMNVKMHVLLKYLKKNKNTDTSFND